MTGVFVGHCLYKAGQSLVSKDISLADEIGTVSHAQQQNLLDFSPHERAMTVHMAVTHTARPPPSLHTTHRLCTRMFTAPSVDQTICA